MALYLGLVLFFMQEKITVHSKKSSMFSMNILLKTIIKN